MHWKSLSVVEDDVLGHGRFEYHSHSISAAAVGVVAADVAADNVVSGVGCAGGAVNVQEGDHVGAGIVGCRWMFDSGLATSHSQRNEWY